MGQQVIRGAVGAQAEQGGEGGGHDASGSGRVRGVGVGLPQLAMAARVRGDAVLGLRHPPGDRVDDEDLADALGLPRGVVIAAVTAALRGHGAAPVGSEGDGMTLFQPAQQVVGIGPAGMAEPGGEKLGEGRRVIRRQMAADGALGAGDRGGAQQLVTGPEAIADEIDPARDRAGLPAADAKLQTNAINLSKILIIIT